MIFFCLLMYWVAERVTFGEVQPSNIAVDSLGNPYILVVDEEDIGMKFRLILYSKLRGAWTADTVEMDANEPMPRNGDIVIDCLDRIWIVYVACKEIGDIKHLIVACKDSSGWTKDTVDTGYTFWYQSIAVDRDGNPHVTYDKYLGSPHLQSFAFYAQFDGHEWTKEVVDTMIGAYCCSIDADSIPHIAYCHRKSTGLDYFWRATEESGSWFSDEVDTGLHWLCITSIRIFDGLPNIAYSNAYGVRYACYNGHDWEIENVGAGFCGFQKALDIDSLGQPYIVFEKDGKTWIACKKDGYWSKDLLPESSIHDADGSVRIDKNGVIHIVRISWQNNYREIWYIYGNVGIEEGIAEEVESGFDIHPNPFGHTIKITAQEGDVDIYDISGRLIDSFRLQGTVEWNTRSLTSGVYFVRFRTEDSVITKKVVKR